jgi:hypothetical protein
MLQEGIDHDFRLLGVSRPTESSLNRWNFIFTNDIRTTTDLEKPCDTIMLKDGGLNVRAVDIFQNGEQPLYGLKFHYANGTSEFIGSSGGQAPITVALGENERIVGMRHKHIKHMYRYGLRFMIAEV